MNQYTHTYTRIRGNVFSIKCHHTGVSTVIFPGEQVFLLNSHKSFLLYYGNLFSWQSSVNLFTDMWPFPLCLHINSTWKWASLPKLLFLLVASTYFGMLQLSDHCDALSSGHPVVCANVTSARRDAAAPPGRETTGAYGCCLPGTCFWERSSSLRPSLGPRFGFRSVVIHASPCPLCCWWDAPGCWSTLYPWGESVF